MPDPSRPAPTPGAPSPDQPASGPVPWPPEMRACLSLVLQRRLGSTAQELRSLTRADTDATWRFLGTRLTEIGDVATLLHAPAVRRPAPAVLAVLDRWRRVARYGVEGGSGIGSVDAAFDAELRAAWRAELDALQPLIGWLESLPEAGAAR